jgi:hypothetical protein
MINTIGADKGYPVRPVVGSVSRPLNSFYGRIELVTTSSWSCKLSKRSLAKFMYTVEARGELLR